MLNAFRAVITERKENPQDKKDLLNVMLDGKDPVTKKGLPVENIRNNVRVPVHLPSYYMLNLSVASDFPYRWT